MRAMLDKGVDQTAVLSRFVDTLSEQEEAALSALLSRAHRKGDS
jgi:hypothetical protein